MTKDEILQESNLLMKKVNELIAENKKGNPYDNYGTEKGKYAIRMQIISLLRALLDLYHAWKE